MTTKEEFISQQKKYFDNFPFDEKKIRDFLNCMKEKGYFSKHDVLTDILSDMLTWYKCESFYSFGSKIKITKRLENN